MAQKSRVVRAYLCHRSSDARWAKRLAGDLRRAGIHAWLDIWDMPPGRPLSDAMQDGILESHAMIIVLSPASAQAIHEGLGGVAFEVHVGEGRRYQDTGFQIIGVLRKSCNPPEKLRNRIGRWLDFRKESDYEERLSELIKWLTGVPGGPPIATVRGDTSEHSREVMRRTWSPRHAAVLTGCGAALYALAWRAPTGSLSEWVRVSSLSTAAYALPFLACGHRYNARVGLIRALCATLLFFPYFWMYFFTPEEVYRLPRHMYLAGAMSFCWAYGDDFATKALGCLGGMMTGEIALHLGLEVLLRDYVPPSEVSVFWSRAAHVVFPWTGLLLGECAIIAVLRRRNR